MAGMFELGLIKADEWGFSLTRSTSEEELLSSEINGHLHPLVHNAAYRSYYTDAYGISGRKFVFSVYFEDGSISWISLSAVKNKVSWDNVERDAVLRDKQENDEWLRREFSLPVPAKFSWGTVDSVADYRGGGAVIVVRYDK